MPFLNILTSKSGPRMWCFAHFDLQMCFAPQRRAIFPDWNIKNGSDSEVFRAFLLANVLRATAACNFAGSKLPKVVHDCGVLCILTCKCASRHSGVQFFDIRTSKSAPTSSVFSIFTSKCAFRHSGVPFFTCLLNSYLRTRRFSEATSSGSTNH